MSPNYEEHLEFLSIKVEEGPLTSKLQHIQVGDTVIVGRKPTGTLLTDYTLPGQRLYLLSTGTGLAPFMSIIRTPTPTSSSSRSSWCTACASSTSWPITTSDRPPAPARDPGRTDREAAALLPDRDARGFRNMGRITELIESNKLTDDLGLPPLNAAEDRVMLCGSPGLLVDLKHMPRGARLQGRQHVDAGRRS